MTLAIIGAARPDRLEEAVHAFEAEGFQRISDLDQVSNADQVLGISGGGAELLRDADSRAIKYVLVHDGENDGRRGGSFERAHHRIEAGQRAELARHLRSRNRPLVTCVAFAYKNGVPAEPALLIDARFLDNPYWVPELKELSGRDAAVVEYVMSQPAATKLMRDVHEIIRDLIPLYRAKGRMHIVVAFGCTGGQHRSVVLAAELARELHELRDIEDIDVEFVTRDL